MTEPRIYTVAEANAALPRLRVLVAEQLERAARIERSMGRARMLRSEERPDEELELAVRAEMQAYEDGWHEVEAMGVVVKDPRSGLCDFYGKVEGKLVFLCWRYGEASVAHYHELEAGFAGRKPLEGAPEPRAMLN